MMAVSAAVSVIPCPPERVDSRKAKLSVALPAARTGGGAGERAHSEGGGPHREGLALGPGWR